jgi:Glutathione-dependent formaldehyde-activating enzyme
MPRELVRLPLVCGSGRCAAHGAGSILDGRNRFRGADDGGIRPRWAGVREVNGTAACRLRLSGRRDRSCRPDRVCRVSRRASLEALIRTHYDHRGTDCQRLTSSAFSMGIVVPEPAFRLSGVEPRQLRRIADSGRINTRLVCPECGTWICGMPRDGVHRVRAGTLDDTSWLRPTRVTLRRGPPCRAVGRR